MNKFIENPYYLLLLSIVASFWVVLLRAFDNHLSPNQSLTHILVLISYASIILGAGLFAFWFSKVTGKPYGSFYPTLVGVLYFLGIFGVLSLEGLSQ
jgi:hypothetical protein